MLSVNAAIQSVNHKFLQDFTQEVIQHYCNGNIYGLRDFLTSRLGITDKEAWIILMGCEMCENQKYSIHHEIIKLEHPENPHQYYYNEATGSIEKYNITLDNPLQTPCEK